MFEIGASLREARTRRGLSLARCPEGDPDPRALPHGARGGALGAAARRGVHEGLPPDVRRVPRPERAALRRRVQRARSRRTRRSRSSPSARVARGARLAHPLPHDRRRRSLVGAVVAGLAAWRLRHAARPHVDATRRARAGRHHAAVHAGRAAQPKAAPVVAPKATVAVIARVARPLVALGSASAARTAGRSSAASSQQGQSSRTACSTDRLAADGPPARARHPHRRPKLVEACRRRRRTSCCTASGPRRRLDRGGVELDRGHVVPELLELVVLARLRREDVQDDVEVVGEDPRRPRATPSTRAAAAAPASAARAPRPRSRPSAAGCGPSRSRSSR